MRHHFHHSPIELRAVGSELAHSDSRHRERSDCHDETTNTSVCERLWLHDNEQRATRDRACEQCIARANYPGSRAHHRHERDR